MSHLTKLSAYRWNKGPIRARRGRIVYPLVVIAVGVLVLVVGAVTLQSILYGLSWTEQFARLVGSSDPAWPPVSEALPDGEKIDFLTPRPVGDGFTSLPKISNLKVDDVDQDGLMDIVVCDCESQLVSWVRQSPRGTFSEIVIARGIVAPAHVDVVDFDGRSRPDTCADAGRRSGDAVAADRRW